MLYFLIIFIPTVLATVLILWTQCVSETPTTHSTSLRRLSRRVALPDTIDATPDTPKNFGYKMSWLAVRSLDSTAVTDSLQIQHRHPANWEAGIQAAYSGHVYVSPPVNGWVLVVSPELPELGPENEPDAVAELLARLSRIFGEVQYFSTHRVVEYHAWAWFVSGNVVRTFAWVGESGEIVVNAGKKTVGEEELGYRYFDPDSPDAEIDGYWEQADLCYPEEEHVMEVAGKWSVNPSSIEQLGIAAGVGCVGNFVQSARWAE